MTYDAATGNVILFGGNSQGEVADTWVWDGSTWTQQHPATSPPAREDASMAYDAATGNVVLFGGYQERQGGFNVLGDTWVWDGSTWTQQHPTTSPPARYSASRAYDAATGNVVLFGGAGFQGELAGTWVWDGSTWTHQHPATRPARRSGAAMAYDAATGNVVLFGGIGAHRGTWIWDGSTWTLQHPTTRPPALNLAVMAYDAATGNVVLFGGIGGNAATAQHGTWVWGSNSR